LIKTVKNHEVERGADPSVKMTFRAPCKTTTHLTHLHYVGQHATEVRHPSPGFVTYRRPKTFGRLHDLLYSLNMEHVHSLNYRRIEWCCQQGGITAEQLASDLGISVSTMQKAMQGGDVLDRTVIPGVVG
jgi:hypothetical protein